MQPSLYLLQLGLLLLIIAASARFTHYRYNMLPLKWCSMSCSPENAYPIAGRLLSSILLGAFALRGSPAPPFYRSETFKTNTGMLTRARLARYQPVDDSAIAMAPDPEPDLELGEIDTAHEDRPERQQ